jgi:hypothetical protein
VVDGELLVDGFKRKLRVFCSFIITFRLRVIRNSFCIFNLVAMNLVNPFRRIFYDIIICSKI